MIKPATEPVITSQCVRVPVLNGHTAAAYVKFRKKPTKEQLVQALKDFKGVPQELDLPSAQSSSFSIWKRTIVPRLPKMWTTRKEWVCPLAV